MLARISILALGVAVAGCVQPVERSLTELDGAYRVQLYNDGSVPLSNVRVTTGQNVPPLTIARLDPGASSGPAYVAALHEHPIVSATVDGRTATFHPVEGFAGFNAQVAPGSYLIRLRWVAEYQVIDTRVEKQ